MEGRNADAFMQKDEVRVNPSKGYSKPFKAKQKSKLAIIGSLHVY